jgi:hypothetical protein
MGAFADQLAVRLKPKGCRVAQALDVLCVDDDDRAAAGVVPAPVLQNLCRESGWEVSDTLIRSHRRNDCSCRRG